jgi:hypothetical protein
LQKAMLDDALLENTDLQGADLRGASLRGANLAGANLQGADLYWASFDKRTILPDRSPWSPTTDLFRFSDPDFPNFWRSGDPDSPAHQSRSAL